MLDFLIMKKKLNKKKTKTRSQFIHELDSVFSYFIRLRDSDAYGNVVCPLDSSVSSFFQAQNMHFISRAVLRYRRDENNCFAWCMRCNVIQHWNYIAYTLFMQRKFWIKKVEEMLSNKLVPFKISTAEIQTKILEYKEKCKALLKKKTLEFQIRFKGAVAWA